MRLRTEETGRVGALALVGMCLVGAFGGSVALADDPGARPHIDVEAMHEAMADVGGVEDHYASSRAYAYYLRAMLAADDGDHAAAVEDLREAEIYDPDSPQVRVALAEQLERVGDLGKAEEELRRSLSRTPKDEPTLVALGRVLSEEKKLSRAVQPLQRALQLKPDDVSAANSLAQVDMELGQEDQAVRVIEALGRAAPQEATGYKFLGQLLAERGEPKRAERMLRLAIARNTIDVETHESLAKLLEDQNRLAEAANQYEQALGADAEEPNVLLAAGSLALRRSDPATAKAYFDQLLSVMPDDVDVKVKMAFAWFGAHRVAEAAQLLDEARRGLPLDARLAFYAGLVHEEERSYDKAAEAFAAVDGSSELGAEAELHLGICLSMAGHHVDAITELKKAQLDHPEYRAIIVALADAYARAGRLTEGIDLLQHAAQQQQADELFTALAELYERSGRSPEAVKVLQEQVAGRPRDIKLLYALALAHDKAGDPEQSIDTMKQLLSLDPDNANALNFIAYTYADHNQNLEEAERMVKKALQLRPDSGAFMDSLGWVYFKRGDLRLAVETLEHAETLSPNEPVIIEHLADTLAVSQRRLDAADAYRRALKLLEADPDEPVRAEIERKLRGISLEEAGK